MGATLSAALLMGLGVSPVLADPTGSGSEDQVAVTPSVAATGEQGGGVEKGGSEKVAEENEPSNSTTEPTSKASTAAEPSESATPSTTTEAAESTPSPKPGQMQALAGASLKCTAGTVYSVSRSGQLYEITNSNLTTVGAKVSDVSSFNGVGIGANGSVAYAYERTGTGSNIKGIYKFDPAAGTWTKVKDYYTTSDFSGSLVAGAVDLKTGAYYFGGFQTDSGWFAYTQKFHLWKYSPSTGSISKVGTTATYAGQWDPGSDNGDIAFDSAGNLFIVRGRGTTTTVYSITAANLASANGGNITSSQSASRTTAENVNGVAFDAAGKGYLGSGTILRSYTMPNWTSQTNAGTLENSTDLASCSSPTTVTLQKNVDGGRYLDTDQFDLELKAGGTSMGTATTAGTANGIQDHIVGPFPTAAGTTVTFSESGAAGTDLGNYTSTASCTADGRNLSITSNKGTTGSITIPGSTEAVVCTITNKAKAKSTLTVQKNFTDRVASGDQVKLSAKDTVNGSATAVGTDVTTAGTTSGVQTQKMGPAEILTGDGHNYTVQETASGGLDFSKYDTSYQCIDTAHRDEALKQGTITTTGSTRSADLGSIDAANDGKVRSVVCTFTNTPKTAQLTLVKKVTNTHGGDKVAADWNHKLHATPATGSVLNFATGETKTVDPGTFTLSEDQLDGYERTALTCDTATVTGDKITVTAGAKITCTFTNADKPGTVTWSKDDGNGNLLGQSEWTLTGPDGASRTIKDCTVAPCAVGGDQDVAKGKFKLTGLNWGHYVLQETRAPAGYVLDDTKHEFAITGAQLVTAFDTPFKNAQAESPTLPLTGGTGTDAFLIVGGLVLIAGAGTGTVLALRRRKHLNG